jgi:hypothetical protein
LLSLLQRRLCALVFREWFPARFAPGPDLMGRGAERRKKRTRAQPDYEHVF